MKTALAVFLFASTAAAQIPNFTPWGFRAQKTIFGEYPAGAAPSDWTWSINQGVWTTSIIATAGSLSGKAMRFTGGTAAMNVWSWNRSGASFRDGEILVRLRFTTPTVNGDGGPRVVLRGGGTSAAPTFYGAWISGGAPITNFALTKTVAGVYGGLSEINFPTTSNTWYWIRFRIQGTTLATKIWAASGAEPGAWSMTVTDSAITGPGWIGFGNKNPSFSPVDIDSFSYTVGAGKAP